MNFNTAVIGLESRKDRWERCEEIFNREGFERVTRYATYHDPNNTHRNGTADFLKILADNRGENLMFFEDDFELTENWKEVFYKAWSDLPVKWDMLYLGCNLTRMPERKTPNLVRVMGAWMLHAVLINTVFIDHVFKYYDINKVVCFDEWCRQIAPHRRFYMTYPMVAYQRPGFSDIENKYVNYDIFNNRFYLSL